MMPSIKIIMGKKTNYFLAVSIIFLFLTTQAYAQTGQGETPEWIKLSSPLEGAVTIEKRPLVKHIINIPFAKENLMVMLDETDITAIIDVSKEGFEFKPIQVLSPGQHKVIITLTTPDKKEYKKESSFTIRHSKIFEEAASTNQVSILTEFMTQNNMPAGTTDNTPNQKVEGNINSTSKIKEKGFELALTGNIRYLDQNVAVDPPAFKGFAIPNYLLSAKYQAGTNQFIAETGDVQADETANTVSGLARRGVRFNVDTGNFRINAFSVMAQQVTGLRNFGVDSGLAFNPSDRIEGASGEVDMFEKKSSLKLIYVRGENGGTTSGSWSPAGGQRGETAGVLFKTDFFKKKLFSEMEYDFTTFDQDTADTLPNVSDKAYRLKLGGETEIYNYEGVYQYSGSKYSSIGSTGAQKDIEGFTLKGGGKFDKNNHVVNLAVSGNHDNVAGDPLLATTYNYQGSVDYACNKFQSVPIGLNYQMTLLESKNEPAGIQPKEVNTNNFSGKIGYKIDKWTFAFNGSYVGQKDTYSPTNDSTTVSYTLAPGYTSEMISITPNFGLTQQKNEYTRIETDTHTATINIRGNLLEKKLEYDLAYNYNKVKAYDGSSDTETTGITWRTGYRLIKQILWLESPTIGLRGNYNFANNMVSDSKTEKYFIFLFFSTNMAISF